MARRVIAFTAVLAITSAAGAAAPQAAAPVRRASDRDGSAPDRVPKDRVGGAPLRENVGAPIARRLIASGDPGERLRGIDRLGALGTPEAIDALIEALEQGSPAGRDPRARLAATRALAPHAARDSVRQWLTRELTDTAGGPARGVASPLAEIIRGTAALALARAGDKRALAALAGALVQGGPAGDAAAGALRAYPPASLQLLTGGKKRLPPAIVALLGDLGDLRAIERLRPLLGGEDRAAPLPAALALAKLGDEAALLPARAWLKKPDPRLLMAAAEVLVYLGAPEAPDAIAALLKSDITRLDGLRLAELLPSPKLARQLEQSIPLLPEEARPRAVAAIGRAGGAEAARALRGLVGTPEFAVAAAFALAMAPGDEARSALEALAAGPRAAKEPARGRLLARAGIVRALALRDAPAGLEERLRSMLASKDAADRAVGALGAAALGLVDVEELVRGCGPTTKGGGVQPEGAACDEATLSAAARGALARGGEALAPFAALLARLAPDGAGTPGEPGAAPSLAAVAAGAALLADPSGGALTTSQLAAWAEGGGPLSPLAARALGSRDDEVVRGRLKRLLNGSDPVVRAHVALGLGRDPAADSVSLLAAAYRFEEDAAVRRAIVRGLSRRAEAQRRRTLVLARDLDPDPAVRSLARAALEGRELDRPSAPLATGVAWITIVPNDGAEGAAGRAARVVRSDGLAVPVVADPDGVLLVPGMPPGPSSVLLASAARPGDAGHR